MGAAKIDFAAKLIRITAPEEASAKFYKAARRERTLCPVDGDGRVAMYTEAQMCLVKVPFNFCNADPLNGCIFPLGIMINEEYAIRDAEMHGWPEESDHLVWLTVLEAYADRFPNPGNLVRDLVRTRSEVLDHPELGLPQTDPGIETRFRVLLPRPHAQPEPPDLGG